MDIKIGVGVGKLVLGLTESQVQAILGLEDRSYITGSGCQRVQFDDVMLECSFEPENENLLGWI
ncbi:MAG: hypothetical protein F6K09_32975 [Merismopedia sp. SIO2A8]|nr:hypothetical protein [Symploca sp. SIO2B6]NET53301.1 hypothetical protein [Merismopedia sp. SIO2A8]